jgi:ADP-heptose:LPS heptosyltransferase
VYGGVGLLVLSLFRMRSAQGDFVEGRGRRSPSRSNRSRDSTADGPFSTGLLQGRAVAPPNRICIFLTGGIGDFLAAVPAVRRLRQNFPGSTIVLVGNPLWLPLARESGIADHVHSIDDLPLHAGFIETLPEDHPLSRFVAGFDLILSWFGDREGLWERNLRRVSPGKVLVRPFHRVHAFQGHASDYYLATLEELRLQEQEASGRRQPSGLRLGHPATADGDQGVREPHGGDPFLCIHPGSGSEIKNWPKERFLEVARGALRLWGLPSTVLLGPAEEGQHAFWSEAAGPPLSVRRGLAILEVARVLQEAALYVGNDSGITHLAAALGLPVVALFGPTDPARWAPRAARVAILPHEVSAKEVLAALERHREVHKLG